MSAVAVPAAAALDAGPFLRHPQGPPVPATPDSLHAVVDARHLLTAVRDVALATPRRPAVPVMARVHVRPVPGGLQLTATDFDTTIRRTIPAALSSGQPVLADPAWLRRAALAAGAGRLTLAVQHDGEGPALAASDGVLHRRQRLGVTVDEWPEIPAWDRVAVADVVGTFGWGALQHLISPAFAAAADETPPVLTALRLSLRDDTLTAAATDRYRLAQASLPLPNDDRGQEVLVRAATLHRVLSRFGHGENVDVALDEQHLVLRCPGGVALVPLMGGDHPPVDRLYPAREDLHGAVLVDRRALMTMVRNVEDGPRHPVRLTIDQDLQVATDSGWEAASGHMSPLADWRHVGHGGAGVCIGLRSSYLLEALASFPHDVVELAYTGPTKPVLIAGVHTDVPRTGDHLIRPNWADGLDTAASHLLMPTRLAGQDR